MNANLLRSRLLPAVQAALPKQQVRSVTTRSVQWELNTGAKIPAIGFGTFQDADAQEEAVKTALKVGFRHIDTARVYDTEIQVGKGIKASGVPREEIFLGTKLWCNSHHPDDVEAALDASLKDLDTPYVDLFLMHYLCTFQRGEDRFPKGADGKMIMGKTTKDEVQTLIDKGSVVPAVHQMELHPYLQQKSFVDWQRANGIHMTHFSPLGNQNSFYREVSWSKEASHMARVIDHPTLAEIAKKHGKTPVQVALAWGVNSGRSVIPKSVIEWQIKENLESNFLLDGEDMDKIARMDLKARFNVPSEEYRRQLYKGLDGVQY
ncbi:aldehyde reductase [Colletotrichum cuscutae]|uniref:Aldehyde reductase n=1 Tax=Colletotrichum cuscutae TaxID=1209917 RepID=A0AAI9V055_9PEZI|nr:aldehyde reductase [Colletotrichum cuscutae]